MNFTEIKEGWGLEEIPKSLRKELQCSWCGTDWPGKLYTNEPLPTGSSTKEYNKQVDRLRNRCYCRQHVEQMFGDSNVR